MHISGVSFFVPVKTVSEANVRGGWQGRARRAKQQRTLARDCLHIEKMLERIKFKATHIKLVRIAPPRNQIKDDDNLRPALKSVRDGIADALGINDGDNSVKWLYDQKKSEDGTYSVWVHISERKAS